MIAAPAARCASDANWNASTGSTMAAMGDGGTAAGTLTPSYTYEDDGQYAVVLTVTDDDGGVGVDTLRVTMAKYQVMLPLAVRASGR